jgi:predicted dehydrogenase
VKVLFAGLGSIGQRHARNLRALLGDRVELLAHRERGGGVVPPVPEGPGTPESALGIRRVPTLAAGLDERPDAVFVTNPTALHLAVARAAVEAGCHVFIEKPLSDSWTGVDELLAAADRAAVITFVGYQLRFHPGLARLREMLHGDAIGRPITAHLEFGEYLPGWHPWEDYRESYAARRDLGGGVLLTQIHDLDYACWLFGMPERVHAVGGHLSDLDVDVEDVACLTLECARDGRLFPVQVRMDYVQRPPVRRCEVLGDRGRLALDLLAGTLARTDVAGRTTELTVDVARDELFVAELRHFLDCVAGRARPLVDARAGAESLRVALAARASMRQGAPVNVGDAVVAGGR